MLSIYLHTYKPVWIRNWLANPWDIWPREVGKGIPRGEVLAEGLFLFLRRQELNVTVVGKCLNPAQSIDSPPTSLKSTLLLPSQ